MKKAILIIFFANFTLSFSQTKSEIDTLFIEILKTKNSREIIKTTQAKKVIQFGKNVLPILSSFFTDKTKTDVYSDCEKRGLLKGEIAIILADHIEKMPYAQLTGIQNCTLSFCEKNPNLIEYYFPYIGNDKLDSFKKIYDEWLKNEEE